MRVCEFVPVRVCSCVKGWETINPLRDKCTPSLSIAWHIPAENVFRSGKLKCSRSEKYRNWRCQQSTSDQSRVSRVLHKRKSNHKTAYAGKSIVSFDIRWRARLRLLVRFARKWSFITVSKVWLESLRKKWRQIGLLGLMISIVGFACLYLRVTAISAPLELPYSDLVTYLKVGRVKSALFEEGSRLIYFNLDDSIDDAVEFGAEKSVGTGEGSDNPRAHLDHSLYGSTGQDAHLPCNNVAMVGTLSDSKGEYDAQGLEKHPEVSQLVEGLVEQSRVLQNHPVLNKQAAKTGGMTKMHLKAWQFSTRRIKHDEGFLLGLMRDSGATYSSAPQSVSASFRTLLITILTLWIPLSPLVFILHRQLSVNSSSSRKRRKQVPPIKFDDVAGVDTAKEELMEIVSCLRGASSFRSLGAKLPKGVLLVGPPGTGKTLLARAVASESGVPFFAASASEFVEMFVGRGAARVRDLFAGARKCSPSIIFVDEIDAVGGRRGRSFNDERDQTLNQLLTELDGFESETGVIVIAATNRPEALDPALCRPGRFSRKVVVKEPDFLGRCQILAVHMRGIPVAEEVEVIQRSIASITPGLVGADLANIVNEAAMLAARQGHSAVSLSDFKEATRRVKFGIGEFSTIASRVESEISRWFGWVSLSTRTAQADGDGRAIPTSN